MFRSNYISPTSIWKRQNKEQDTNPIYKYINLKRQGVLVEVMNNYGPRYFNRFIRKELPMSMYNDGMGGMVTKREFMVWSDSMAFKLHEELKADETIWSYAKAFKGFKFDREKCFKEFLANCQGLEDFKEHEACWELKKRGSMGESIIHLAMLGSKLPSFNKIIFSLLNNFPKLALDVYEGLEYKGESGLHIAIVNKDYELVKLFIQKGANINARATGLFFLPEDQKEVFNSSTTNYRGLAYYGEYPLAFAVCMGDAEMYNYLIEHGANPDLQDMYGNTVLHMIVISNQLNMLSLAVNHHQKKANLDIVNSQKLTPLTLACKLGKKDALEKIYQYLCVDMWSYSRTVCSVYPLASLDSIKDNGKCDVNSALIHMVDWNEDNSDDILEDDIINQLLIEKWKKFVKKRFFERFLFSVFELILISIIVYTRLDVIFVHEEVCGSKVKKPQAFGLNVLRNASELLLALMCVIYLVFQVLDVKSHGLYNYIKEQSGVPSKYFFNLSCLLIPFLIPLRFTGMETLEKLLMALIVPCAWANMLFFLRTFYFSGVYLVVFYKMLTGDLLRIGVIYFIFMIGFSNSFIFMFKVDHQIKGYSYNGTLLCSNNVTLHTISGFSDLDDFKTNPNSSSKDKINAPFQSITETIITMFLMTFGDYQNVYASIEMTALPVMAKLVYIIFSITIPIILINMLTATFVNACDQVIKKSKREWKNQWTKIILILEKTFTPSQLKTFQEAYSIKMAHAPNKRGLVVIRSTKKSKARRRYETIMNWRKLVDKIIAIQKQEKEKKFV